MKKNGQEKGSAMRGEAWAMWRSPRMVVLSAVCAAVFSAAMIPFKVLVIFPGLAEVRPASVLPIVFSLLFGPVGAWGSAFGNLVGDVLGGMLGPGSIFGFAANFAYGYIPYKLWEAGMGGRDVGEELVRWRERSPTWISKPKQLGLIIIAVLAVALALTYLVHYLGIVNLANLTNARGESLIKWRWGGREVRAGFVTAYLVIAVGGTVILSSLLFLAYSPLRLVAVILVACLACAGILGWGIELLGFLPFRVFAPWVLGMNFVTSLILAPPLLLLLYPRVAKRYMLYRDLLADFAEEGSENGEARSGEDQSGEASPASPTRGSKVAALVVAAATVVLFVGGVLVSPDLVGSWGGLSPNLAKGLLFSPLAAVLGAGLFRL